MIRPEEIEEETAKHHSLIGAILEASGAWGVLTIAIVAVATAVNIIVLVRSQGQRVNAMQLAMMLKKLIDAGNVERAIKLCHANASSPTLKLALVGLEARERKEDPRRAMSEARPALLRDARTGVMPAVGLGLAALVECLVMIFAAEAKGFPANEIGAIAILPACIGALTLANAMRWRGSANDLDTITRAVG